MSQDTWNAVDQYYSDLLIRPDDVLEETLATSAKAGLPSINVSASQGKLLYLLARMQQARNILEVGTLGGYSTIWLARALRDLGGQRRLVTLEVNPRHAEVARANFARAELGHLVDLRIGPAIDVLPQLATEGLPPFDMTFIDADKPTTADYFEWAIKLSHPGSIIIVDNVVRGGRVADPASTDGSVLGIRRFNDMLASNRRVSATAIQTVGTKGYDGFTLATVLS